MKGDGSIAERTAANYLRKKKYRLIDFNYSTRIGEIDLIFETKKNIVFVEVKARNEDSIAEPKEFVDYSKQKKIIASAEQYLASHKTELQPRFDVVEIIYKKDGKISIKHLENAFTLD